MYTKSMKYITINTKRRILERVLYKLYGVMKINNTMISLKELIPKGFIVACCSLPPPYKI